MYLLIGISMVLTGAMISSFLVSGILSATWRVLELFARRLSAKHEARFWMVVGLAPSACGLIAGLLVVAPAFLVHEPQNSGEELGGALAVLTAVSALILVAGAFRSALVMFRAAQASRALIRFSNPMEVEAPGQNVFEIADASSTSTVVGILRPTMFFSHAVVEALTTTEFASVLRHEQAHVSAYDNAVKLLLDFAGVLSMNPLFARAVKARWLESIELAADAAAVSDSRDAVELLSALVKVARLRQSDDIVAQLGCGFVRFSRKSTLKRRVEQLQRMADGIQGPEMIEVPRSMNVACRCVLLMLGVIAAYSTPALMLFVHSGFERLMR